MVDSGYFKRTRARAVGTVQILPQLPGNQKLGIVPGEFVPASDSLNDRFTQSSPSIVVAGNSRDSPIQVLDV